MDQDWVDVFPMKNGDIPAIAMLVYRSVCHFCLKFSGRKKKTRNYGSTYDMTNPSGQIITTSAEVTPNGGLIRELPQNPLNSGLGIILICPDPFKVNYQCINLPKFNT